VATLEQAVVDLPEETEARVELARVLCLAKKPEEAVRRLEADVVRWPERLELRAALGYSLREARRSADALPVLEEVGIVSGNLLQFGLLSAAGGAQGTSG
jgi:hypothetical protein